MTRRKAPINHRLIRLRAFAEVLALAIVLRFGLNALFKACGIDIHVEVYEIALIWLFCV
jgi:hypothetical protein